MEVKKNKIGANRFRPENQGIEVFDYIGTHVAQDKVKINFFKGNPTSPLPSSGSLTGLNFGTLEEFTKLSANFVAKKIIEMVERIYKGHFNYRGETEEIQKEIEKTSKALQKLNYKALSSGLLEATANEIDTSITKQDFSQMQPIAATSYSVDGEGGPSYYTNPRQIYNQQTGKYVIAADESFGVRDTGRGTYSFSDAGWTYTPEMETYRTGKGRIMGYDAKGQPIYDLNYDNQLTGEDFTSNLDAIKATIPSATATNVGNYIANQSAATAATTAAAAASGGGTSSTNTSGTNTAVNSGNRVTNNNSSTTIIKRNDSLDVLRSMGAQTAVPITG
jgi:hypothetical protein